MNRKFMRIISLALCAGMTFSLVGCASGAGDSKSSGTDKDLSASNVPKEERVIVKPEDVSIDLTISISPLNASKMNSGKFEG